MQKERYTRKLGIQPRPTSWPIKRADSSAENNNSNQKEDLKSPGFYYKMCSLVSLSHSCVVIKSRFRVFFFFLCVF